MFVSAKSSVLCATSSGVFQLYDCMVRYEQFSGIAMFDGVLGIVFKCVVGAFLLGFVLIYVIGKLKRIRNKILNQLQA